MAKKVLVTGATGNIAGYLIPQLISKGFTVNAYVHNESKADKIKQPGVEIFEGDFTDQTALRHGAARGADTVFSLTPANADAVKQASAVDKSGKDSGSKIHTQNVCNRSSKRMHQQQTGDCTMKRIWK